MDDRRFALLFPGQGAQAVGMGRDLVEAFPDARSVFEKADQILGFALSRLCWEGPSTELTRTEICQPALYVTSLAAFCALDSVMARPKGPKPSQEVASSSAFGGLLAMTPAAAAGLSLGEYTALAAAGAFSFEDGLRLVRLRGQAMEEASRLAPGTMASILGLQLAAVEAVCAESGAEVANINSPGQIVISGPPEAVRVASEKARQGGAKRVVPLEVGGAFHSRLMEPATVRLKRAIEGIRVQMPRYPVVSNVTGSYYTDAGQVKTLLVEQLNHPVQWESSMRTLLKAGIRTFLEVGPGTVLKGLLRKIDPEAVVHSVGTAEEIRQAAAQASQCA